MAPRDQDVLRRQTSLVIQCLLEDKDPRSACRTLGGQVEVDAGDDFDPVIIADQLRQVADSLNDSTLFRASLNDLKKAAAQEAVEAAFSQGVEALCKTQVLEAAPEMQLIKASVTFGLYVKKSCPELISTVKHAMTEFLTRRVGTWVAQQGGWEGVTGLSD